jgi:hypothetical protein
MIWIAASSGHGPWFLSTTHHGVAKELNAQPSSHILGPGVATFVFETLSGLYESLDKTYRLGVSLPDAPLERFQEATISLPKGTETERLIVQRVGQDIFRKALLKYWNGRCPLTGITDTALLKASHIIPWAECETDELRLDVHNGLLLSALWDAAFDKGLVSFSDEGLPLFSPELSPEASILLGKNTPPKLIRLTPEHQKNLSYHRHKYGFL